MQRFHLLYVAPTVLLLALATWPLISGDETLYIRDVLTGHYPMKVAQAEALRHGEMPLVDPYRAGGQPLLGNPNALPLYPDNLLYLVASPLWALNAHFWLHLLLAPFAAAWLGRAWGLRREAAWAVGVCYAASGFFLSLFNLYNLVAGAALAPAFIAACLDARSRHGRPSGGFAVTGAGVLWALLLLAGDPLFAGLALLSAVLAVTMHHQRSPASRSRRAGFRLAAALGLGTLVAAPMLVEFLRILPLSFRGYLQYTIEAALAQSWDPRSLVEWLLPFFFGRPDFTFWGMRFHGGNPPLFYSLYPGLLALALVLLAGRPRGWRGPHAWSWTVAGAGLFFATGAWNPIVRWLHHLPGASVLRYPVKMWLAVALGAALLCGLGCERLLAGERRRFGRILAAMTLLYAAGLWLLLRMPAALDNGLRGLDPRRLAGPLFDSQRLDWAWHGFLSVAILLLFGAIVAVVHRRNASTACALLLAVHLAAQCFLLQPLYDSDAVEHYAEPPRELLDLVPEDALVVHGGNGDLFGKLAGPQSPGSPLELFPDPRFFWLARVHFAQLYPFSGVQWGRRYAFNHSPEGLDTFFVISLAQAVEHMSDTQRVRILRAAGVDVLLLDRELDAAARELVRLRAVFPAGSGWPDPGRPDPAGSPIDLYVYEVQGAALAAQMTGTVLRAPHMNRALALLTSPDFDPRTMVVLPSTTAVEAPSLERPPGAVEILVQDDETLDVRVSSEEGGVLVTRRAFLGIYRAAIDGEPAATVVANGHLLGVEVPRGEHRVRLWADRRPTAASWFLAFLALAGLGFLGRRKLHVKQSPDGDDRHPG
ncbi:MAG: hypothetical protein V3T72_12075 [Thermoanaerobaculia bacterium]